MKKIMFFICFLMNYGCLAQDCLQNSFLIVTVKSESSSDVFLHDCIVKVKESNDSIWQQYNTSDKQNCKIRIFKRGIYQIEVTKKDCGSYFDKIVFTTDTILKKHAKLICKSCSLYKIDPIRFNTSDSEIIEKNVETKYELLYLFGNYNKLKIELRGHTNSYGSDEANMKLSLQRANAIKEFFVKKGIDANRIVVKGYGETLPINRCVDNVPCSEEEHQANDRVETKILSF